MHSTCVVSPWKPIPYKINKQTRYFFFYNQAFYLSIFTTTSYVKMSKLSYCACSDLLSDDAIDDIKLNVYGRTWQSVNQEELGICDSEDILQEIRGNVDDLLGHIKALTAINLKHVSTESFVHEIGTYF